MKVFFILLAVLITISNPAFAREKIWAPEELDNYIISRGTVDEGEFLVKAYVVKINNCYCPPNAQCKPCKPVMQLSNTYRKEVYGENLLSDINVAYDYLKVEEPAGGNNIEKFKSKSGAINVRQGEMHVFRIKTPGAHSQFELVEVVL